MSRQGIDAEMETFSEYAERNGCTDLDEEKLIYEAPGDIAGLYMWVSCDTADEIGPDKDQVPEFRSKPGIFQRCKK